MRATSNASLDAVEARLEPVLVRVGKRAERFVGQLY